MLTAPNPAMLTTTTQPLAHGLFASVSYLLSFMFRIVTCSVIRFPATFCPEIYSLARPWLPGNYGASPPALPKQYPVTQKARRYQRLRLIPPVWAWQTSLDRASRQSADCYLLVLA